jgi:amidohydrolase
MDIKKEVARLTEELIAVRRDLHMYPELAFEEQRTANIAANHLRSLGYEVHTGIGGTGVIGLLDTGNPGKTLMIRADMDALPVQEIEGRSYGSKVHGKMHACGHDGHTAVAMAVAKLLAQQKGQLVGRVVTVFQPAEEIAAGAKAMLDEGFMRTLKPDAVLGFHLWSGLKSGEVGVREGFMWASMDQIKLSILGEGAHGGAPHLGTDSLLAGAHVVVALQELISREVNPFEPALFTQGIFRSGTQFNIIPKETEIRGSCRALDDKVRDFLLRRIREVTEEVAAAFRCQGMLEVLSGTPSVWNDPAMCRLVREAAIKVVGKQKVLDPGQAMAGDDIAYLLRETPGCYFLVGIANEIKGTGASHHTSEFDIDEDALPVATEVLTRASVSYLRGWGNGAS